MRIEDSNRMPINLPKPLTRSDGVSRQQTDTGATNQVAAQSSQTISADESRAQRLERLKQSYSQGKPIDVEKLAGKLMETGIFFDKKA